MNIMHVDDPLNTPSSVLSAALCLYSFTALVRALLQGLGPLSVLYNRRLYEARISFAAIPIREQAEENI